MSHHNEPSSQTAKGGWQEFKGKGVPGQGPNSKAGKQGGGSSSKQTQQNHPQEETKDSYKPQAPTEKFEYKEHKTLSTIKVMALTEKGPQIYTFDTGNQSQLESIREEMGYPQYPGAEIAKFSPLDGRVLAVSDREGIHFVDMETKKESLYISRPKIIAFEWTPKGNYVITCEKFNAAAEAPNLTLWNAKTGERTLAFEWRNSAKEGASAFKFDDEEKHCARLFG